MGARRRPTAGVSVRVERDAMTARCIFVCTVVVAVGCLGGYGLALPSHNAHLTRDTRAIQRPPNAPTTHPHNAEPREGRTLILNTLSALAGKKISKLLNTNALSTSSSSSSSSSSALNSLSNWFANPFNVTLSLGVVNNSSATQVYIPTPIYNASPIATGVTTGLTAYRGAACNGNPWPPCASGVTPCNSNALPACYYAWPPCNSNVLPNCGVVLAGVACNNNTYPYCVDLGVPCNSNDLNYCINAPSPCNDNNWPYCPGYGALAASFDGVVNGVLNGGGGVNGALGPNGAFFSANAASAAFLNGINVGTGTTLTNGGVNGAFFTPANKRLNAFRGQTGNDGAPFVKDKLLSAVDASSVAVRPTPTATSLGAGLLDAIASANSTPPWTFELTRPSNRQPKPLAGDRVQKYIVAISPLEPPSLDAEAMNEHADNDDAEDDDFGLKVVGDRSDPKVWRGSRKPHRGVRVDKARRRKPFRVKPSGADDVSTTDSSSSVRVNAADSKHAAVKAPDSSESNALVGLPGQYRELAKISRVTFAAEVPSPRRLETLA